jgi:hypothetical protein
MRLHFFLCFSLAACGGGPVLPDGGPVPLDAGLDVNDVSFLFPLTAADNQMLPMTEGMLPSSLYNQIPSLESTVEPNELRRRMKVVGVRVDPCFPKAAPPAMPECIKQLRLVVQPVFVENFGATTNDAAIHLFYQLSDQDFQSTLDVLAELHVSYRAQTFGQPLAPHPVMKNQGLGGEYARKIKELVTSISTQSRLTRVAFMLVLSNHASWTFGALDVENGSLKETPIPRLGDLTRQGVQEFGSEAFRNGELSPRAPGDELRTLISESSLRFSDERTLRRAFASALLIENPHLSSPKTIDCASCHVASRAKDNALLRREIDTDSFSEKFKHPLTLRREDEAQNNPFALRAFGYFKNKSAFSQRTINESALIAEELTTMIQSRNKP